MAATLKTQAGKKKKLPSPGRKLTKAEARLRIQDLWQGNEDAGEDIKDEPAKILKRLKRWIEKRLMPMD